MNSAENLVNTKLNISQYHIKNEKKQIYEPTVQTIYIYFKFLVFKVFIGIQLMLTIPLPPPLLHRFHPQPDYQHQELHLEKRKINLLQSLHYECLSSTNLI